MADKSKALTWTELRVGVVMIASLAILAVTTLYVGGGGQSPFAPKYAVRALMSDVNGLKPGAPVRVGGVDVGTVTKVALGGEGSRGLVEVVMRLDERVKGRVTTESRATLGSLGLLGEKAVDISAAGAGTPIEDGGYLAAEAEDPFKGLLIGASESTQHIKRILARMDAGQGLIGKALRDDELYERMLDVSVRLQHVMAKLESSQGPLGRLMNDQDMSRRLSRSVAGLESIVSRVDAGRGALGALTRDDELAADLRALVARLNDVAAQLQRGDGTAGRLLKDDALYNRLDGVTARLDVLLVRLDTGDGTAARLLRDPTLYDDVSGTLRELRGLVADIRKDPRKYLRVKVSLF
jgi:phospholipid/cholesterol/gamma-HCH transport system substrate-binding protein